MIKTGETEQLSSATQLDESIWPLIAIRERHFKRNAITGVRDPESLAQAPPMPGVGRHVQRSLLLLCAQLEGRPCNNQTQDALNGSTS